MTRLTQSGNQAQAWFPADLLSFIQRFRPTLITYNGSGLLAKLPGGWIRFRLGSWNKVFVQLLTQNFRPLGGGEEVSLTAREAERLVRVFRKLIEEKLVSALPPTKKPPKRQQTR
jgi:hypothetical protein